MTDKSQPLSGAAPAPQPKMIVVSCPNCQGSVTAVSVNRFAICTDKECCAVFNIETLPAPVAVPAEPRRDLCRHCQYDFTNQATQCGRCPSCGDMLWDAPPAPLPTNPENSEMCPVCQSPYCRHEPAEQKEIQAAYSWLINGGNGHEDGEDGFRAMRCSGSFLTETLAAYALHFRPAALAGETRTEGVGFGEEAWLELVAKTNESLTLEQRQNITAVLEAVDTALNKDRDGVKAIAARLLEQQRKLTAAASRIAQLEQENENGLQAVNTYTRLLSKEVELRQTAEAALTHAQQERDDGLMTITFPLKFAGEELKKPTLRGKIWPASTSR